MIKTLIQIVKNRAKIGAVNFILEMVIGILTEWQRANSRGNLDFMEDPKEPTNEQTFKNPFK